MVTYGAMGLKPLTIPNGMLIFKNLKFTGFWVNKWYEAATPAQRAETFAPLFEMAQRGLLRTKVDAVYSLDEATAAVSHAMQNKRGGKIVFIGDCARLRQTRGTAAARSRDPQSLHFAPCTRPRAVFTASTSVGGSFDLAAQDDRFPPTARPAPASACASAA